MMAISLFLLVLLSEIHKHNPKQVNKTPVGKRKLLMAFFIFMEIHKLKNIITYNIYW